MVVCSQAARRSARKLLEQAATNVHSNQTSTTPPTGDTQHTLPPSVPSSQGTYDLTKLEGLHATIQYLAPVPMDTDNADTTAATAPHEGTRRLLQSKTDRLDAGSCTPSPGCLVSNNGKWSLCMQADGNIVLYDVETTTKAFWASGTVSDAGPFRLCMQADGNLVGKCWDSDWGRVACACMTSANSAVATRMTTGLLCTRMLRSPHCVMLRL